ncbi:AAA family ATPase, partial [Nocardiopsis sp. MG754419]|uniref:AAA family ATPase n=1 Tax=Nocardiopsis sp. MG754419 TaxID=2259865 RepID=UPI001BAD50D5
MISVTPLTRRAPLYGRDRALSPVRRLVDAARSGSGGALIVTGAPGMGRTALLDRARAEAHDLTVLHARATPSEQDVPLAGLHQLLTPVLEHLWRLAPARRAVLAQALETGVSTGPLPLANAVLGLLTVVAEQGPLMVCVDDLHLLDPPSLEATAFVARRLPRRGVAALFSAPRGQADRLAGVPSLSLGPLDRADLVHLLTASADLAPSVATELADRAEGNPGAALEALAAAVPAQRTGAIALDRPPRTRGDLTDRYARAVATLPDPVRLALLRVCAEPRYRPTGDLEPARRAGLVTEVGGAIVPAHPLVRSACYHGASPAERSAAHLDLAPEHDADRAAWHRALAVHAPDERAAADLQAAALRAVDRHGHRLAALLHEHAARL